MCNAETEIDPFKKLIQGIRNDPEIKKRIIQLLKMDSYQRRFVLNNWLEQLRRSRAPEKLIQALSCLFDDTIAKKFNELINSPKKNNHTD